MNEITFIKFELTPGEKYLGIASVNLLGKIVLRYKIVSKKDNSGYFPAPASLKIPAMNGQAERYVGAFTIDSNALDEEIRSIVMTNVNAHLRQVQQASQNANMLPSQYGIAQPMPNLTPANQAWPAVQPNPNYYVSPQQAWIHPPALPELPMEDPNLPF